MRYLIHLAYNGAPYSGWQRQKNTEHTIQERIEDCLGKLLGQRVPVVICGRTDRGVHALNTFAHFDTDKKPLANMVYKLNRMIGNHIQVYDIYKIKKEIHAQHSVISREYVYKFHTRANPFIDDLSWMIDVPIKLELLEKCLAILHGKHDFVYFCKQPDNYKSTICNIRSCRIVAKTPYRFEISILADRFLRSMMRLLIYEILAVATGKSNVDTFERYLSKLKKPKYFNLAPSKGLYLAEVKYPPLN